MTEISLQNQIRKELSKYGVVLRLNVGTFATQDGRYVSSGLPPGTSDLLFIGNGYIAFIEVKRPGYNATDQQTRFLDRMLKLEHRAGVAHSVKEALEIIGEL